MRILRRIFSYGTKLGVISAIDDEKVTSSNRFYFNSNSVRGFDLNGIGPRDKGNDNAVGGNKFYTGQVEVKARKLIPGDLGIDISVFSDIGSLWGVLIDDLTKYGNEFSTVEQLDG